MYETVQMPCAAMSPRISSTAIEPPITNCLGPSSVLPLAVPPARIGTSVESPNICDSCANAGAENPATESGTDAVMTWPSTAAGLAIAPGSGAESSQLLCAGPSADIASAASTFGVRRRQSSIVAPAFIATGGLPAAAGVRAGERRYASLSFLMYSSGVQPPSAILLN